MPSKQPRTPEVEISEDTDSGFKANIYDGEYLIQVRPHENGYQLSLASKTGIGDAAFLRTYGREERFRELLKTKFEAIDSDAVFEVLEEHFDEEEYRIVNLKESVKTFHGRGADLYVETGETIPTLTDDRDYRDDQWSKDNTYRLRIWPSNDLWIEFRIPIVESVSRTIGQTVFSKTSGTKRRTTTAESAVRPLYQVSTHPWVHQSWKTLL